jgi:hypothetical protein
MERESSSKARPLGFGSGEYSGKNEALAGSIMDLDNVLSTEKSVHRQLHLKEHWLEGLSKHQKRADCTQVKYPTSEWRGHGDGVTSARRLYAWT